MDFSSYFLLADGRLRAGWRLLLFVTLLPFAYLIAAGVASMAFREPTLAMRAAILSVTAAVPTWVMMRWLERQSFLAVGITVQRQSLREAGTGLIGGVLLAGSVAGIEWAAGAITFQASGTGAADAGAALVAMTLLLAVSAATEELLFRGYAFQRLVEGSNAWAAIAVSSLIFGWLHASNPHATRLSVVNTILAGVLLSLCYLKTRALWLQIGVHFSWNWTVAMAGLPVSGLTLVPMPWRAVASARLTWLHGGDYGPEGGAIATFVLALGVVYLTWKLREKQFVGEAPSSPTSVEPGAA